MKFGLIAPFQIKDRLWLAFFRNESYNDKNKGFAYYRQIRGIFAPSA